MTIYKGHPLQELHTMGCLSFAEQYGEAHSINDLRQLLSLAAKTDTAVTLLGGGSNTVFCEKVAGLVVRIQFKGIVVESESGDNVMIRCQSGENWHQFVRWTLDRGFYGLENLSLIPGTVGAAPIQNIGAYGVEVKTSIQEVVALHRQSLELRVFNVDDCHFGYRDSVFKQAGRDWVILNVLFKLSKTPNLNLSYHELKLAWENAGQPNEPKVVGRLVEAIRRQKLPDPIDIPNSGSFFKNPSISESEYQRLLSEFPNLVAFPNGINRWKLAAGWLIQECGWKGYSEAGVGVFHKQALVLVNPGHCPGEDIRRLAQMIQQSVLEKFAVSLEIEPVIL